MSIKWLILSLQAHWSSLLTSLWKFLFLTKVKRSWVCSGKGKIGLLTVSSSRGDPNRCVKIAVNTYMSMLSPVHTNSIK